MMARGRYLHSQRHRSTERVGEGLKVASDVDGGRRNKGNRYYLLYQFHIRYVALTADIAYQASLCKVGRYLHTLHKQKYSKQFVGPLFVQVRRELFSIFQVGTVTKK